ncbi:synaptic vesicle glycoprotein 2A-like [Episyrphus balteatus]|uniref:synaptic vesicle glycoprotein 2A-like n=1 Tax=Episyrphus balteatus TaxID=286459 RepID=UPI002485DCD6|nr:synaptic vesicle glycoprotein 2A-like [Episyrphus balteatus]
MAASSIFSITAMLLPILAWGIINQSWSISLPFIGIVYKPWRLLILVCGSIGLFAGLIMMLFPESPKFLLSKGKTDEAIDVLKKMHKWNVRSGDLQISEITADEEDIQVQNDTSLESSSLLRVFLQTVWNQTIPLFQKTLLIPTILICTIQFWMCVGIYGIFMWYPIITDSMVSSMSHNSQNVSSICDAVYAKQAETLAIDKNVQHCTEKLEDRTFIFSIMMEFFFGMGYVVIGILVQKVQKKHILFATLIIFGTCGVLTNLINDKTFSLITFNMFFISGIGIQLLCGITIELYPTHLRAMAICISVMFGRLGGVAGASITGLMMASNCEMTFYIAGTGLIVSGFLTLLIPKKENEKTVESVVE